MTNRTQKTGAVSTGHSTPSGLRTRDERLRVSDSMSSLQAATFGAGCFWGVEETFRRTPGILETEVGYSGGKLPNPTYENVCAGTTGHAEAVRVKYDPSRVSYEDLVRIFWENHDPTQLNRQGPDIGTQYRSVIFYHTPEQKRIAEESKAKLEKNYARAGGSKKVATEIVPAAPFYRAEEYHQQYIAKGGAGACRI